MSSQSTLSKFPSHSFPTPPDDNQPLDFSAKRPRLSSSTPQSPTTPILSIPTLQPRRLQQPDTPPSLPSSPLPLTMIQQNLKTNLGSTSTLSPMGAGAMSAMTPFLFNPGLCLPSLLQMMSGQAPPISPQPMASPPPTPHTSSSSPADKSELLKVNSESLGQYALFRQNMLRQLAEKKLLNRRDSSDSSEAAGAGIAVGQEIKDQAYWERRRKNNLAAKRSRDARRAKEDEIAIRAAFLEQENIQLKWEVARLKSETGRLRTMLLSDSDNEDIDPGVGGSND